MTAIPIQPINKSETLAAAYMLHMGMYPIRKSRGSDFMLPDGTLIEVKSAKQLFRPSQKREIATAFNDGDNFILLLTTSDTIMRFKLTDLAKRDKWPFDRTKIESEGDLKENPWMLWDVGNLHSDYPWWRPPRVDEFEFEGYR